MGGINENPVAGDDRAQGDSRKSTPLNNRTKTPAQALSPWKRAATETLLTLRTKFPQCFARLDLSRRQPLKIGIHADIVAMAPELRPVDVGRALKFYAGHVRYLASCTEGTHRIDLAGQAVGIVTAAEAAHAAELLAKIKGGRQRQARPNTPPRLSLSDLKIAARKRASAGGAS